MRKEKLQKKGTKKEKMIYFEKKEKMIDLEKKGKKLNIYQEIQNEKILLFTFISTPGILG